MKKILLTSIFLLSFSLVAEAQTVSVETLQFGTDVQSREVVGADTAFASSIGSVYCFTRITGVQDTATITHVWYYDDDEQARVELPVRGTNWRTWSSKTVLPSWTGRWSVDVLGPDGEVLRTEYFTIAQEETTGNR